MNYMFTQHLCKLHAMNCSLIAENHGANKLAEIMWLGTTHAKGSDFCLDFCFSVPDLLYEILDVEFHVVAVVGVTPLKYCNLGRVRCSLLIPVAERSKEWVCSRSPAGIAGSNPAEGMVLGLL
jgi:hypothetical protein